MMKTKSRMAAALTAVFLCLPVFTLPAYAQSTEPTEEPPAQEETTTAKPFTPEGTGTVVDNATDEDGKEFYTIQTPDEHIFFLVIDKQRTSENVYFLDTVTEKDLLSLAQSEKEPETVEPEPEPTPAPQEPTDEPEPAPAPEPEKKDSPIGTILLVLAVAVIGGGPAGTSRFTARNIRLPIWTRKKSTSRKKGTSQTWTATSRRGTRTSRRKETNRGRRTWNEFYRQPL